MTAEVPQRLQRVLAALAIPFCLVGDVIDALIDRSNFLDVSNEHVLRVGITY